MKRSGIYVETVKEKILQLSRGMEGEIFLYGSRANGNFGHDSDLDIGCANMSYENFRYLERNLFLFLEESLVPYDVDLVDFSFVEEPFRNIALKDRIIWKTG